MNPWLRKFRGLSKPGLEQSVRTYGFVRTLNLTGAPLHGLLDCSVVNVFRWVMQEPNSSHGYFFIFASATFCVPVERNDQKIILRPIKGIVYIHHGAVVAS